MKQKASPLKALQILHTAMLAGMVLFGVVSAVVRLSNKMAGDVMLNKVLQVTALAITFILIKTGLSIFDKKLQTIPSTASPVEKLNDYRTAAIIKWAMIEGPALFAIICFMITRNYAFIALAFALIIFFALQAPAKLKLMLQLQISEPEFDSLQ
jgi:hypothetical protein